MDETLEGITHIWNSIGEPTTSPKISTHDVDDWMNHKYIKAITYITDYSGQSSWSTEQGGRLTSYVLILETRSMGKILKRITHVMNSMMTVINHKRDTTADLTSITEDKVVDEPGKIINGRVTGIGKPTTYGVNGWMSLKYT